MKFWSASRKGYVAVEDMSFHHARNALAKLDRGDYLNEQGEAPGAVDTVELRNALQRQVRNTARPDQVDEGFPTE